MTTVTELLDRDGILRALRRYSQGVDQRDWELYARAFTADALIDIPGYLPGPLPAPAFAELLGGTFDDIRISGQHLLANTLFAIDGVTAHTVTEFMAVNSERSGQPGEVAVQRVVVQRSGGLYVDDLAKDAGEWRIRRRVLVRKSDNQRVVRYDDRTCDLTRNASRNPAVAGF